MREPVLAFEHVFLDEGRSPAVEDICFSIPRGGISALLGRDGAIRSSLVSCALGKRKPSSGRVRLFGRDARKDRRKLRGRVGFVPGEEASAERIALELERGPELLILEDARAAFGPAGAATLLHEIRRRAAALETTVWWTACDSAGVEAIANRVEILSKRRLVIDEDLESLRRRFRRISYMNEITETRTEYGTELDRFDAVRVKVRGWGVEAIVSNFEDAVFEDFVRQDGVESAIAAPVSLDEIFAALTGDPGRPEAPVR
ncbi:MAG: ATP-binding cassette domain-containing protein [Thermoanaerobaculia bacterium]